MNWETIVILALVAVAFVLVAKKGSCCGTKSSKDQKGGNKDESCCGGRH